MSLKPKDLGVTNKELTVDQVAKILKTNIPKQSKAPVTQYLQLLVKYFQSLSPKIKEEIIEVYTTNKKKIAPHLADIKNDFGEIIGGMATISQQLLKEFYKNQNFSKGKVEYPVASNEPLKDYSIIVGKTQYIISAKVAGAVSNTVKPQDIIKLIQTSKVIDKGRKKTLTETLEYKILETLGVESTLYGPGLALAMFKDKAKAKQKNAMTKHIPINKFPGVSEYKTEFAKISEEVNTSKKTSTIYTGKIMNNIIASSQFKAYGKTHGVNFNSVRWADLILFFEYVLQNASKDTPKALDFGALFIDAITSQVHYIKMQLNTTTGLPEFEAHASVKPPTGKVISNFKADDMFLRSKSSKYKDGRYRLKDKVGIQT
jgi:hypothetical protein